MRKIFTKFLYAVLLLAFLSGSQTARAYEDANASSSELGENKTSEVISFPVGKDAPTIRFIIKPDKIILYSSANEPEILQEITYAPAVLADLLYGELVEIVDMNFDGYMDMQVLASSGKANAYYQAWLWDTATERFVLHEDLSALSSPSFDAATKTISSFTHVSAVENYEETYAFSGNKLVLLQAVKQTFDSDRELFVTRVYKADAAGSIELVSEEKSNAVDAADGEKLGSKRAEAFPNGTVYKSPSGFSLLLPEGAVANAVVKGVDVKGERWLVSIRQSDVVADIDQSVVQATLEDAALKQNPFGLEQMEWAYGRDSTTINGYDFYRRPFTGTINGEPIEMGELYYANIDGKNFKITSVKLSGIGDGVILLYKMLDTFVVD